VPHRQIVFTIPKRLRVFFKFDRRLLGDLCRCALRSLICYFEVVTGSALTRGVIAVLQTFGDRINLHVHLHFLVTEGRTDEAGVFHKIQRIDDSRLEQLFAREVLRLLVGRELLRPEWAERILSWRHSGFSVHSLVRAKTKIEAERVGKYMIRPSVFAAPDRRGGTAARPLQRLGGPNSEASSRTAKRFPKCGGTMKVVAFLTEPAVVDRIIEHLKLAFVAERPPPHSWSQERWRLPEYRPKRPPQAALPELLWEVDPPAGYFPDPPAEYVP